MKKLVLNEYEELDDEDVIEVMRCLIVSQGVPADAIATTNMQPNTRCKFDTVEED